MAEHSFYVSLWVGRIAEWLGWSAAKSVAAIHYAQIHDLDEVVSGDLPSPFKSALNSDNYVVDETMSNFRNLFPYSEEECLGGFKGQDIQQILDIIKLCDLLEAAVFCAEEMLLGNQSIHDCYSEIAHKAKSTIEKLDWLTEEGKYELAQQTQYILDNSRRYESGITQGCLAERDEVPF